MFKKKYSHHPFSHTYLLQEDYVFDIASHIFDIKGIIKHNLLKKKIVWQLDDNAIYDNFISYQEKIYLREGRKISVDCIDSQTGKKLSVASNFPNNGWRRKLIQQHYLLNHSSSFMSLYDIKKSQYLWHNTYKNTNLDRLWLAHHDNEVLLCTRKGEDRLITKKKVLIGIDALSGKTKWENHFFVKNETSFNEIKGSHGSLFFVSSQDKKLIAFDKHTGRLEKEWDVPAFLDWAFICQSKKRMVSLSNEIYWEIDLDTLKLTSWDLGDIISSLADTFLLASSSRFTTVGNYLIAMGYIYDTPVYNHSCILAFNMNTKKVDWFYDYYKEEGASIPVYRTVSDGNRFLIRDKKDQLSVFQYTGK